MSFEEVLNHYRKEEHAFVERAFEWAERVEKNQQTIRTDFVDPRQLSIIKNIVNSFMDLTVFFDGGYEDSERGRALIAPEYWVFDENEMGLAFFKVISNNKFSSLSHKDYLGALMNIGLKREKFGDILITENQVTYIVSEEISDYVRMELKQIGNQKISLEEINREELATPKQNFQVTTITVSSLRLDNITSQVYNQSRSKISEIINGKNVKVNWGVVDRTDYTLEPEDIVSVRGFGRYKFIENEGTTKKGRIKIKIGKLL